MARPRRHGADPRRRGAGPRPRAGVRGSPRRWGGASMSGVAGPHGGGGPGPPLTSWAANAVSAHEQRRGAMRWGPAAIPETHERRLGTHPATVGPQLPTAIPKVGKLRTQALSGHI